MKSCLYVYQMIVPHCSQSLSQHLQGGLHLIQVLVFQLQNLFVAIMYKKKNTWNITGTNQCFTIYMHCNLLYNVRTVSTMHHGTEWMSEACLTPNEQFFSYIIPKTSYISMKWRGWCPVCTTCTVDQNTFWIFIILAH